MKDLHNSVQEKNMMKMVSTKVLVCKLIVRGEYLKKAKELDQFFIDYIHSFNDEEIPREVVEGYDEYGQGGSWKRIL